MSSAISNKDPENDTRYWSDLGGKRPLGMSIKLTHRSGVFLSILYLSYSVLFTLQTTLRNLQNSPINYSLRQQYKVFRYTS